MSLSILIPVYNFDVHKLVNDLYAQCVDVGINFEILLVDDCSNNTYKNEQLSTLENVYYEQLNKNIGRSKIRNYLASKAEYDSCLILDCDVEIPKNFINKYVNAIDLTSVVVGGHKYLNEVPKDASLLLHWKYGREVEAKSLSKRVKKPYDSFMTNSFLIPKKIFNKIKFNESITKYGHEDTLFGIELEYNKIPIRHIENPVIHLGLKSARAFLKGEKEAIKNLIIIAKDERYKERLNSKSRLLYYENSRLLNGYYSVISMYYKNSLYKRLLGKNPSLKTLNFWKFYNLKKIRNQLKG